MARTNGGQETTMPNSPPRRKEETEKTASANRRVLMGKCPRFLSYKRTGHATKSRGFTWLGHTKQ